MKPGLQLHRSLTFWAGLLVIIFTCWVWRDSCNHSTVLRWKQISVASGARGLMISNHTRANWNPLVTQRLPNPNLESWPGPLLPAPFLLHAGNPIPTAPVDYLENVQQYLVNATGPDSWSLFLPYWLILIPLLIAWSALLLWRARHRRTKLLQIP